MCRSHAAWLALNSVCDTWTIASSILFMSRIRSHHQAEAFSYLNMRQPFNQNTLIKAWYLQEVLYMQLLWSHLGVSIDSDNVHQHVG